MSLDSLIEAYADRKAQHTTFYKSLNRKQGGDPAELAKALLTLIQRDQLRTAAKSMKVDGSRKFDRFGRVPHQDVG